MCAISTGLLLSLPSLPQKSTIRGPIPTSLPAQRLVADTLIQGDHCWEGGQEFWGLISLSSALPCSPEAFRLWGSLEHVDDAPAGEV